MGFLDCVSNKISATGSREVFTINMASNTSLNQPRTDLESQTQCSKLGTINRRKLYWHIGLDLPLFLIVMLLIGLYEYKIIPSHKAGYYCNDPALSFPFRGDTVSNAVLMTTVFLFPLIFATLTEFILQSKETIFKERLKTACWRTVAIYKSYGFGLIMNFVVVEVMKGITGRPRPTFFALCAPDTPCNGTQFVDTFECTSSYPEWLQYDSYHSFPSGHTSLSVHAALFIVWYLQCRAFSWRRKTSFLVPFLQMLAISYALICSLTRITDHRHHWWDVLTGAVIGTLTAVYSARVLLKNFRVCTKIDYEDNKRPANPSRRLYSSDVILTT